MEEDTHASSDVPVMKSYNESDSIAEPIKAINGDSHGSKKEEDETALEGEFIKVEREPFDEKEDGTHKVGRATPEDDKPSLIERSSSNSVMNRELLEAQEKTKELEHELDRVVGSLKHSESENSQLKDEISLTKEKLAEAGKKHEELEIIQKKLQEHITDNEEKYSSQLNTLQEALKAQEEKHKELGDVKEAFDSLSLDIEISRKKMQEMEDELRCSAIEAHKFEELHKQTGTHAESETQRALEFEKLLELAKSSAKELEDQMALLQMEVKDLYEKNTENKKTEEALTATVAELSSVREDLELSKSQVLNMEHRLSTKENLIDELTQELDMRKVSESQIKEDFTALGDELSSMKEDLQAKVSQLEDVNLKLQEEVNAREVVEAGLKTQEAQVSTLQEELAKVVQEKEALEVSVAQMKEYEEKINQMHSTLSESSLRHSELELELKNVVEKCAEHEGRANTTQQRSLELEDMVQKTHSKAEDAGKKVGELELLLETEKCRIQELEEQIITLEKSGGDAQAESKKHSDKVSELQAEIEAFQAKTSSLEIALQMASEKEKELSESLNVATDEKNKLEVASGTLSKTLAEAESVQEVLRNELTLTLEKLASTENDLKDSGLRESVIVEKHKSAEEQLEQQRKLIEEAAIRDSEAKSIYEKLITLEEQIITLEKSGGDAHAESKKHSDKVFELQSEFEAHQVKTSSLEVALQMAGEKEKELSESLNVATEEKNKLEIESDGLSKKLAEAESAQEVLRSELTLTQQKLASIENDLKDSGVRESEIMQKLKSAEEQLDQQGKLIEEAARRGSEAKSIYQKLINFEEQIKVYEEKVAEGEGNSKSLKEELEQSYTKHSLSESINEELQKLIKEAEDKAAQSGSDNDMLVETNMQLKIKLNELEEMLTSTSAEKEATSQQLAFHKTTVTELTDKHSRAIDLHTTSEARVVKCETQLQEAIQKFTMRDSEASELLEKLLALEGQIKTFENQTHEASGIAETQKAELEETLFKLNNLQSTVEELKIKKDQSEKESDVLAEANMNLTQKLAEYESQMKDFQEKLSAALVLKDEVVEQLHSSKKSAEDLTHQLTSEGKTLQDRIYSVMEENTLLTETYKSEKLELETKMQQLEGQLREHGSHADDIKAEMENKLKAELDDKSALQTRIEQLEEQLEKASAQLKEEVELLRAAAAGKEAELCSKLEDHVLKLSDRDLLNEQVLQLQKDLHLAQTTISEQEKADSQKSLEQDAALKHSLDECEAKNKQVILLENQMKELEHQLELSDAKLKEKVDGISSPTATKKGIEVKSRDFEVTEVKSRDIGSTLSKRKSKKKLEATSASQTPSSLEPHTQTTRTHTPTAMTLKIMLGVAVVSVIIGIMLGKRY